MGEVQKFAEEKGRPDVPEFHRNKGWPEIDFTEHYTRHAKTLIAFGHGAGKDRAFGLKTEFIALTSPYDESFDGQMQVELRLDGVPQSDTMIPVFEKDTNGTVTTTTHRTDAGGQTRMPVTQGHSYLLDSVGFAPATEETGAHWLIYWAALTFAVPE